ncbi:MAG: hypothetical protein AB7H81_25100, partial [Vicinamibacterales bacterium]
SVTHAPLANVLLSLCDEGGCIVEPTSASGTYTIAAAPGSYHLFTRNSIGYTNEFHDNLLCQQECASDPVRFSATPVVLSSGVTFTANFDLDPGAVITGAVTDAASSAPLAAVNVGVAGYDSNGRFIAGWVQTDAAGVYTVRGLPAGRYYAATSTDSGYVNEAWNNLACGAWCWDSDFDLRAAMPIDLAVGATSSGKDFALDMGNHITGLVTDEVTTLPVDDACAFVIRIEGGHILEGGENCGVGGSYDVGGLATGSYYVYVQTDTSNYIPELFDNVQCRQETCLFEIASATLVPVTVGVTTSGRDFALEPGGVITGTVRDAVSSAPLPDVEVWAFSRINGQAMPVWAGETDGLGVYRIEGLEAGTYYAATMQDAYLNEIYDDIPCADGVCTPAQLSTMGTPVMVTAGGGVSSGVDFGLRTDAPPGPPGDFNATVNGFAVSLSWTAPDTGQPATSYVIEAGLSPGATIVTLPVAGLSTSVPGVGPGSYYVRVRGVNANGAGAPSEERLVVVSAGGSAPPDVPRFVRGWMSGQRLTLTWGGPASGGMPSGFVVEAGSATGVTNIASIGVAAYSLVYIPVPPGFYFVRVRAVNGAGSSAPSAEVLLNSGNVPSPPEAPDDLEFSVAGSTVTLTWEGVAGATSYVVRAGSAPGLSNLAQLNTGNTATTLAVPGVPPGRYYVRAHALNVLGASVASNEVVVVVP